MYEFIFCIVYSMNTLIIISSKSPNPHLYRNIEQLYALQSDERTKICVVDSDSNNMEYYHKVQKDFPLVDILFAKNTNYEYGAWKIAYERYPNYDIYMCIQDSIICHKKIPIEIVNDTNAFIFFNDSGYHADMGIKGMGIDNLNKSDLQYHDIIDTAFRLAQHSSFVVSNVVLKDIFTTLKEPPTNKIGSCFMERNFGLYFILKHIQTHNMHEYCSKYTGGRH